MKRELRNILNNVAQCSGYMISISFVLHRQNPYTESEQWKKTSIDDAHMVTGAGVSPADQRWP